jgi:methylenetetrahydrofolate--tRNA-(uracil-5-)-methyltransferase
MKELKIIGGGLAGSEAAWQAANAGIKVTIYEMRTKERKTQAHHTDGLAELVCSNSFRSDDHTGSAIGLLHEEMRRKNSIILKCADEHSVPAGGALAVDRDDFSKSVSDAIASHNNIQIKREEIENLPSSSTPIIIATGPLTSEKLSNNILQLAGEEYLSFFDAIAPIIHRDSIDMEKAWFQSRYDKGTGKDYINCPMTKEQYFAFIDALVNSDKTEFKEWEKDTPYFDGCLPIEIMAQRGVETLRFGPMKPVGLTNPHSDEKPYAVVQLRQDNKLGTLYNIVGFQTKMKYGEQVKVFKSIPGLENAEFARLGGIHRNTFINSPKLLDNTLRLKKNPLIRFAGQITGVEGYVESAACGLMAGKFAAAELNNSDISPPPPTTALGALLSHITGGAESETFQPMNINFGLIPPLDKKVGKKLRKAAYCERALNDIETWAA